MYVYLQLLCGNKVKEFVKGVQDVKRFGLVVIQVDVPIWRCGEMRVV